MSKKIFLPFYKKCIDKEYTMPYFGLCGNFDGCCCDDGVNTLSLFQPDAKEKKVLEKEGFDTDFWGYGFANDDYFSMRLKFTPLRQTIVLFMAAMNNEL